MNSNRGWNWLSSLSVLTLLGLFAAPEARPAGVTVITHGFGGDADGWVLYMAGNIPGYHRFPGTNIVCYKIQAAYNGGYIVTPSKIAGGDPTESFNAEIVVKLDWGDLAGFLDQHSTFDVAAAVAPSFLQPGFIPDLHGRALAELPIHLIGHSRGGSLACELSYRLGINGVWVDQVTTLDPHPVNNDGNIDPLLVVDAPLRIYDNVLFADNYYQEFDGYPHGQFMLSSYNRELTALPGGYSAAHSDTHLWYHATIDFFDPADDGEALLHGNQRLLWFSPYELSGLRAGFHYSRLGGGDRLSTDTPMGQGTDRPVYGYNRRWDFGAGTSNNRTSLPANSGDWPNIVKLNLTGTDLMEHGQTNNVALYYQWARPAMSNAVVSLFLDDDYNPYNGNEQIATESFVPGTGMNQIGLVQISVGVNATNAPPGVHSIYARISDGRHTRYLFAPELLTVMSSFQPPTLSIEQTGDSQVRIGIDGVAGQRIVLQGTTDFGSWVPLGTNWLETSRWSYTDNLNTATRRFYRATVE